MDSVAALPRLLYLGNPPVIDTVGGAGLLYRILGAYPQEKLALVWTRNPLDPDSESESLTAERHLIEIPAWSQRSPRADTLYTMSYSWASSWWVNRVLRSLGDFRPEAVVSVTHGLLWETAIKLAGRIGVPCYLVHHDHWTTTVPHPVRLKGWVGSRWQRACRLATDNLCVSPGMQEEVRAAGAKNATLLLPGTSPGTFTDFPPPLRSHDRSRLVFGYAGSVQTSGHMELIRRFAAIASARGHSLRIFSPYDEPFWRQSLGEHYRDGMWGGFVPGSAVPATLRAETDAVFLPLSFLPQDADNMRVSFPCKLCDYSASGRPVIVWAPAYSSVAQWIGQHENAFLLNTADADAPILDAISTIEFPESRLRIGQSGFEVGKANFSAESVARLFQDVVVRAQNQR